MGSMTIRTAAVASLLAVSTALGACASGVGAGDYPRSAVGQVARSEEGVVMQVRPVRIEGTRTIVGPATGAVIGGVAGSQVGGGDEERAIAAVAGAVLGGLAGAGIENAATERRGFAYTVRKPDGQVITVVQGADIVLSPGAPVWINYGDRVRITPR